jgi:hypothetical protein
VFKEENPLSLEEIKDVRKKFREEHSEEYTPQRLFAKYKVKADAVSTLERKL